LAKRATNKRLRQAAIDLGDDVRVGTYTRRSTDEDNQPYSIDVQNDSLDSYVNSQPGWRIVKKFTDDASGATSDRDGLQKALKAARAGLIDVLLVYRVDRFSRNLRDMVTLLDELDMVSVVFRSATEPFDTSTPMGRMLVQMLGMFAQFERDTIVDRVISGMENKAAKGKWKGGRRPFGYTVDKDAQRLIPLEDEAAIVRLIFDLYTRDRIGSNGVAAMLTERGHRTTTGKHWSPQQVLRVLANRIYLGELTFRNITVTNTHTPIVSDDIFGQAQRLLEQRGESLSYRAASGSDYLATGRINCPQCGKAMIGTRATGRTKTYRYYTCWTLARYGPSKCDFPRLNADALDNAILDAAVTFYRSQHDLIAEAVAAARQQHNNDNGSRTAELAAIEAKLAQTTAKIDRYLDAFEEGKMDPEAAQDRVNQHRATQKQLRVRRDELQLELDAEPTEPDRATLHEVSRHINKIITAGNTNQRKALIEVLIARIKITGPDRIVPVFRVPQPDNEEGVEADISASTPPSVVRTLTHLVETRGIEPLTPALQRFGSRSAPTS
jgi:site-specific DNA recombinase